MDSKKGFSPYPDFLKIYNSQEHSQCLVIPREYNKYYPKPLPETAILQMPEGDTWTVKWTISQEETISFQDGWDKFVKDNGLLDRDFLLFTYDGSQSFWVRIHRDGFDVKKKPPLEIQVISDDEDDHHVEEEDNNEQMIILHDGDNDDTMICEVNNAHGSSKKGRCVRRGPSIDTEKYLDDPENPFFISTSSCTRLVLTIANQTIRDYLLKFGSTINLIDGFGELSRKVGIWHDRIVVYKWDEMYKRNNAKPGDVIICEIIREEEEDNVVSSIKVHFVKN
ncbi:unnamed protein product [Arabidopsis arenosa]|uniref:TF-B3 domain-containing protein n=1 Tax=Arabidopsis arenosa TaxID=38785 RepID=A0A8S2AWU0_ARAAE|nr:unnamed protein product [Arabidopsis arenosa]